MIRIFLCSLFALPLSGCVVTTKHDMEWTLNAMHMIGRLECSSGYPYEGFERVKLKYDFPSGWYPEFHDNAREEGD